MGRGSCVGAANTKMKARKIGDASFLGGEGVLCQCYGYKTESEEDCPTHKGLCIGQKDGVSILPQFYCFVSVAPTQDPSLLA